MAEQHPSTDQSKPKQSRRRYGWWVVFALVVLLFSVGLPFVIRYQQQIALLDRIEQAGGGMPSPTLSARSLFVISWAKTGCTVLMKWRS